MNKIIRLFFAAVLVCGIIFEINLYAEQAKGVSAIIALVKGKVLLQTKGSKSWLAARNGQFMRKGDALKTGPASKAGVVFANGIESRLNSNTAFRIEEENISAKGKGWDTIRMRIGKIWIKTLKQGVRFNIKTPIAVCAIRGTEYETGVEKNGRTEVKVFSGTVEISNEFGSVEVDKDSKSSVDPGAAPAQPTPLGKSDKPVWQEEAKSSGKIDISLASNSLIVNEIVEGKLTVLDANGTKNNSFKGKIELASDNTVLNFSESGSEKWAASLELEFQGAEAKFKLKSLAAASSIKLSATNETLGASMLNIESRLPSAKVLKLKIKNQEGNEKEFMLKFKTTK